MKRYVYAITGATGAPVGMRVLRELAKQAEVHLLVSSQSFSIVRAETGIDWSGRDAAEVQKKARKTLGSRTVIYHDEHDLAAPVSSGSFRTDGMFVVPCSMKTLSGISHGYTENLVQRAADVTIKEGRQLVLAPREMPFSPIHLENMLNLARIGVKIVPPVVGFYHGPKNLEEMIDFIAGKILDAMGVEHSLFRRWTG
ncbi:MAG: flavin prenyltransferase UbiX [Thermodesulfovibrionales bacterium]